MASRKWGTTFPEEAITTAQRCAAQAGEPVGEWIARAIRAQAMREGTRTLYDALAADPELAQEWTGRHSADLADAEHTLDRHGGPAAA